MTFLWGALTGLLVGGTLGFLARSLLTAGARTDYHREYARGWTLGYHAGKNAREE